MNYFQTIQYWLMNCVLMVYSLFHLLLDDLTASTTDGNRGDYYALLHAYLTLQNVLPLSLILVRCLS